MVAHKAMTHTSKDADKDTLREGCAKDGFEHCRNCLLGAICLPIALTSKDVDLLDNIIERKHPLQRGEHLYREKDHFSAVYAVRSGAIKTYHITDDGQEQVNGFFFPGEIIGMDGIGCGRFCSSATALETTSVCEIPFEKLGELSTRLPSLQRHFFQLMSQEITEDQKLITLLSKSSSEQRLAALLLSVSARNARRNLSETRFRLPMSRTDIGNYLGLTVETVSRLFTRFSHNGLLTVDNKEVALLDLDRLRHVASVNRYKA
ncbi:fumarate/nitrate reduction transcriptional regulator Fnr [Litorivivens sp.]|uniref:fumarate/nitrate reduction transcriptional regulator Fnr n=1 Tax=Litorivivens sp. TaxID=2020868 RepID=UPI003564A8EE